MKAKRNKYLSVKEEIILKLAGFEATYSGFEYAEYDVQTNEFNTISVDLEEYKYHPRYTEAETIFNQLFGGNSYKITDEYGIHQWK